MRLGGSEARITLFDSQELLAELIDDQGHVAKVLIVRPSGTDLYFGLPTDRGPFAVSSPFLFFDMAFAIPLAALDRAYPGGPATVAPLARRQIVGVEGRLLALETRRTERDLLAYTVDGPMGSMAGEVRPEPSPPWPDDRPMSEWTTGSFETFATLGLARTTALGRPLSRFDHQRVVPR